VKILKDGKNYKKKFTPEMEKIIYEEYLIVKNYRKLARKYSCNHHTIMNIVTRNSLLEKTNEQI